MSPETASLYHILADATNNIYLDSDGEPDTSTIAGLRNVEPPLSIDSDDSVRDPNYYCADAD